MPGDPLEAYSEQLNATMSREADLKKAANKDEFAKGLASVKMNANGETSVTGHRDYINKIVQDAQQAPVLRAQLGKINEVLSQQLERVDQQEQFVSSHPILSVLARVSGAAAQDPRMPPLVRAMGATAAEMYPTPQQTGGEKMGILREMLASSSQEGREDALSQRIGMQLSQLDERTRHEYEMERLGGENADLRKQRIKDQAAGEAERNRLSGERNEISRQREKDSAAWHSETNRIRATAVGIQRETLGLKKKVQDFKEKGGADLKAASSIVASYDKKQGQLDKLNSEILRNENSIVLGDEEKAAAALKVLTQQRDGIQKDLEELRPSYEMANKVRDKKMQETTQPQSTSDRSNYPKDFLDALDKAPAGKGLRYQGHIYKKGPNGPIMVQ